MKTGALYGVYEPIPQYLEIMHEALYSQPHIQNTHVCRISRPPHRTVRNRCLQLYQCRQSNRVFLEFLLLENKTE